MTSILKKPSACPLLYHTLEMNHSWFCVLPNLPPLSKLSFINDDLGTPIIFLKNLLFFILRCFNNFFKAAKSLGNPLKHSKN